MEERFKKIEQHLVDNLIRLKHSRATNSTEEEQGIYPTLSHTFSYLFNYCLANIVESQKWMNFGSDDLIDADYQLRGDESIVSFGLMIWGERPDTCERLTPFRCSISLEDNRISDFRIDFAARSPDDFSLTLTYTKDEAMKKSLMAKSMEESYVWPLSIARIDVAP